AGWQHEQYRHGRAAHQADARAVVGGRTDLSARLAAAPRAAAESARHPGDQADFHSGTGAARAPGAGTGWQRAGANRLEWWAHHAAARNAGAGTPSGCRAGQSRIRPASDGAARQGSQGQALMLRILLVVALMLCGPLAMAQEPSGILAQGNNPLSIPAITLTTDAEGQQEYSVSLQILLIMT